MKKKIILTVLFISMLISIGYNFAYTFIEKRVSINSGAKYQLKTSFNRLWGEQAIWTRQVAFHIIDELPGTNFGIDHLFKTQNEISDIFASYYGSKAGEKLSNLLRHTAIWRIEMFKAIKLSSPKNTEELEKINIKWKENADKIAILLCQLNPYWKLSNIKNLLYNQISQTTQMALARKNKLYRHDINHFDKLYDQMFQISDTLTNGIIQYFPNKFDVITRK